MSDITITAQPWRGPLNGKLARKYEARCLLCGRPKPYQTGFYVNVVTRKGTTAIFAPLSLDDITIDNHSDYDTVGTGCGKKLPAEYRVPLKKVERKFVNEY